MPKSPHHSRPAETDHVLPEYDFAAMSGGVRGKYAKRARAGSNVVVIDPDLAVFFPDSDSVNFALRHLAAVLKYHVE